GIPLSDAFSSLSIFLLLLSYPARGNQFWSSARAGNGIIFIAESNNSRSLYVAHINFNKPARRIILTSTIDTLRFSGQPWVYGDHIYLFETSRSINDSEKCLTGRLVRTDIEYGRLELIETKFDNERQFPEDSYSRMPHRMWNVTEFYGSETSRPAMLSLESDFKSVCSVSMLNMDTLSWKKLNWSIEADFDQLTLDVTPQGTVVLLKKLFFDRCTRAIVDSFYFIKTRYVFGW
uniref:FBA_1 domain-containing protein n=1 Tax=Ascaris lumbricoides TaxID=6252 RepID=A0A0M3HGL3_ASCLU